MLASIRIAGRLIIMLGQGDPYAKMAFTAATTAGWHCYGQLYHSRAYWGKIRNAMLASSILNCNMLCLWHVHGQSAMFADLSRSYTQALTAPLVSNSLYTVYRNQICTSDVTERWCIQMTSDTTFDVKTGDVFACGSNAYGQLGNSRLAGVASQYCGPSLWGNFFLFSLMRVVHFIILRVCKAWARSAMRCACLECGPLGS